jgi:biopolymer transport protein ExbD
MRFAKHSMAQAEMDMTPMIDVTFQLIAFFMFVLNFTDVDQDQRVNLPLSELARPPDVAYEEPLTVQLTDDEMIIFGGDYLAPAQLKAALLREGQIIKLDPKKKVGDVTVIIRADRHAKTGKVQEIIKLCQECEFDTFALRGKQSDTSTLVGP